MTQNRGENPERVTCDSPERKVGVLGDIVRSLDFILT
jgi:hypothetical protein